MNNQIKRDITQWSRDQLTKWYADTVTRYEIIGLSNRDANIETMSIVLSAAVWLLHVSGFPPDEISELVKRAMNDQGLKYDN